MVAMLKYHVPEPIKERKYKKGEGFSRGARKNRKCLSAVAKRLNPCRICATIAMAENDFKADFINNRCEKVV
jgi:hypothetical protein